MKKIFFLLGTLLIASGLKAQKNNVQKETVKPQTDTLIRGNIDKQLNKAAGKKEAKIAPVIKYAPASKGAPAPTKAGRQSPAN